MRVLSSEYDRYRQSLLEVDEGEGWSSELTSGNLRLPFGTLYKVKNVKSSQGKIVGLHWSKGRSRFCPGLSHNHKVKTLGLRN